MGPGKIYFRGPYLIKFSRKNFLSTGGAGVWKLQKNFPDEYVAITSDRLYLFFTPKLGTTPKQPEIFSFARDYSTTKKDD